MKSIKVDSLSKEVMRELEKYKNVTTEDVKSAVKKTSDFIKKEIKKSAPKNTGNYSRSWKTKKTRETPRSLSMTVYTPTGYRISHLLEYGHAKRGGGRVSARVHIKPSEDEGIKRLEKEIKESLRGG